MSQGLSHYVWMNGIPEVINLQSTTRMQVHNSFSVSLRRCQWVPELNNIQNIERRMTIRIPISGCRFLDAIGSKCAKGPAAALG